MNIITRIIERLLYGNRKAIINVENGDKSRVVVFNLTPSEQIVFATFTLGLIVDKHIKSNNLSYKDKEEVLKIIVKKICEHVKVNISIDTSV